MYKVSKELSANDVSETGGHQAGMLIPKDEAILKFFPELDNGMKNPRCHMHFEDIDGMSWEFAFIYYNNKFFGGTRNEYRLTRMTKFFRRHSLCEGDKIVFERKGDAYCIETVQRSSHSEVEQGILILGTSWRIIGV